jgi:hypothetical protein
MDDHRPVRPVVRGLRNGALLLGLAGLLTACGGGGGTIGTTSSASSGSSASASPSPPTGGTVQLPRDVVQVGLCGSTCYASVAAGTSGTLDGTPLSAIDIGTDAVGVARGVQPDLNRGASFKSFEASSVAVGPVDWIDTLRGRIGIAGQTVHGMGNWLGPPGRQTGYDVTAPLTIGEVRVGDRLLVHGFDSPTGPVIGTGIRRVDVADPDRVTGVVASVDAASRRLRIGAQDIDFSAANVDGFPTGAPRAQDRIEAIGRITAGSGVLRATLLRYLEAVPTLAAGTRVYGLGILGKLSQTPGTTPTVDLQIAGQNLRIEAVCVNDVVPGMSVQIYGVQTAGAYLSSGAPSDGCSLLPEPLPAWGVLKGRIEAIDLEERTVTVLGARLRMQAASQLGYAREPPLALADLRIGDGVQAELWGTPVGGNAIISRLVRYADAKSGSIDVEAWVGAGGADYITFLQRPVRLDANSRTYLRDCSTPPPQLLSPIGAQGFLAAVLQSSLSSRAVTMTIARDADGSWRVATAEVYNSVYCD